MPEYVAYHDAEWGRPMLDDTRLFEKLCLEGFQSGLSWLTILRKRENFRAAFAGFAIARVAEFDAADVDRLLGDAGIIRHRGKIEAAIANARATQALIAAEGSLAAYLWRHAPAGADATTQAALKARPILPEAAAVAKDLRRRGFRFTGPTTMTALFQAAGLVNDHLEGCWVRPEVAAARAAVVAAF